MRLLVILLALGLAVGATWPEVLAGWLTLLWIVFVITAVYFTFVGFKQMYVGN